MVSRQLRTLPRGALVRYREDYGASGPGKGLKLTAEQVADRIIEREHGDKLIYGVLDLSAFKEDGGPSIAERINTKLIKAKMPPFREADNARVSRAALATMIVVDLWAAGIRCALAHDWRR